LPDPVINDGNNELVKPVYKRLKGELQMLSEVLCIGEAMVLGVSTDDSSLASSPALHLHVAGAEANVASGLASQGVPVQWWSRVGADPFGTRILAELAIRGVSCSAVERDAARPTGVYFKERPHGSSTTVHYYRAGSAASAMSIGDLPGLRLDDRRLVHLTGITPALSPTCDELVEAILKRPRNTVISFDVNYRPALWPDRAAAADRLRELADSADIVFVGRDEGELLWGARDAAALRSILQAPRTLVVKDADTEAVAFHRTDDDDTVHSVPALAVHVVEPVGAGDAFAAGYLAARLEGLNVQLSLRSGHLLAGHALLSAADVAPAVDPAVLDRLRRLDDDSWSALQLPLPEITS
jgi:2-dehydro-3-deoxygluconokinase